MKNILLLMVGVSLIGAGCAPISDTTSSVVNTPIVQESQVEETSAPETKITPLVDKQETAQPKPTPTKATPAPEPKKTSSSCDPNYSGCVPIASDVDCAGGTGNGPAYTGRTTVIGIDIYDLDRDGDGVACE